MARFEATTCYHCEAEGTGREHVPPRCLFPKGSDWPGLMTVPSCEAHNNANSKADEYLKFLLGATASDIPEDIRDSTARGVLRLAEMRSNSLQRYGFQWECETLSIDKPIPLDIELLRASLEKIARALYFHHYNGHRKLMGDLIATPLFIPVDPEVDPQLSASLDVAMAWTAASFEDRPKFGPHPEIFAYQIVEKPAFVIVTMEFYGAHRATVLRQG